VVVVAFGATFSALALCSFMTRLLVLIFLNRDRDRPCPVTHSHDPPVRDGATDPYGGSSVAVAPIEKSATANFPFPSDPVFTTLPWRTISSSAASTRVTP